MGDTIVIEDNGVCSSDNDEDEGQLNASIVKSEPSDVDELTAPSAAESDDEDDKPDVKPDVKREPGKPLTKSEQRKRARQKLDRDKMARMKPDFATDRERERLLARLATQGVVQLFNAVTDRQSALSQQADAAGKSEFRRLDATAELRADAGDFNRRLKKQRVGGQKTDGVKKEDADDDVKVKRAKTDDSHSDDSGSATGGSDGEGGGDDDDGASGSD